MAECSPSSLLASGRCIACLTQKQIEVIKTVLLCRYLQSLSPAAECSPGALLSGSSFRGLSWRTLQIIKTQLLCDISGGGSGAPGLFGLCFADSNWFTPAYSTVNNRVGASNASLGGLPDSRIKLYDVEETGLVNIGNTRVQSGGVWVASVNKFYFGVSSGGTVPGSPSTLEAIVMINPITFAISYVGGFTDPSATSSPTWVSSTSRVWFRLSGATPGFTILDPTDNSHIEITDPLFTLITAFVYVPSEDAIYATAFDEIIKIDATAPYTAAVVYTATDTTFTAIEYVSTTGRLWIGYKDATAGSQSNGVLLFDPTTDLPDGSIVLLTGATVPAAPTVIYHSAAFGLVLIQEALFFFPTPRLVSTDDSGSGPLTFMDATLGRITGKGIYIPAVSKELLPFSSATGICLTYLTEAEFSGSILPSYNCTVGSCVDPEDGTGTFAALGTCEASCLPAPPLTYDCVSGSCVARTNGTGQFNTMAECEADCPCEFVLDPLSASFPDTGGSDTFDVATGAPCEWTAVSNDAWITVDSGTPGTGNGTVGYTVAANAGAARDGTITAGGETFDIHQAASGGGAITSPDYFWPMEELGDFDTRVDDIAAKTMVPSAAIDGEPALIGNGAHWVTNSNANLTTPGVSTIPYTTGDDFSFNFWIKQEAETGAELPEFEFNPTGTSFCRLRRTSFSSELILSIRGGGPTETLVVDPVTFDTSWHMWTVVYDGATGLASLYRDTVLLGTTAVNVQLASATDADITFDGNTAVESLVDLFGAWLTYSLTPAEITSLFNGGLGRTWPF